MPEIESAGVGMRNLLDMRVLIHHEEGEQVEISNLTSGTGHRKAAFTGTSAQAGRLGEPPGAVFQSTLPASLKSCSIQSTGTDGWAGRYS